MKISAPTTDGKHLLYDPHEIEAARVVAVLVPGAFCRVSMFEAAERWRAEGYALVTYRFPGLDGRPLFPPLDIAAAAAEFAELSRRFPDKRFRLLGFSTGGAIVLTAAGQMEGDVKIAAMSCAVERGGGAETAARALRDLVSAAFRARSLRLEPVWLTYYKVLLFGYPVLRDPELDRRAAEIVTARRDRIVFPDSGKSRAHTRDLRSWRLPPDTRFAPGQLRLFRGSEDPVFTRRQTDDFARRLGGAPVTEYPGQGHLLFASHPPVFEDVLAFFEAPLRTAAAGA